MIYFEWGVEVASPLAVQMFGSKKKKNQNNSVLIAITHWSIFFYSLQNHIAVIQMV